MASDPHVLLQQRSHALLQQRSAVLEPIKALLNPELKEICKFYKHQVSGTKAILQKRCIEILDDFIARGDTAKFEALRQRILNRGRAPEISDSKTPPSAPQQASTNGNASHASPSRVRTGMTAPHAIYYFRPSPFWDLEEEVLSIQMLPEMPQNRNTVKAALTLSADVVQKLKADKSMRLLLFSSQAYGNVRHATDVAFPSQIEIKINGDEVRHNYKGLKNKPGSTKPVDITSFVRIQAGYPTQIVVMYALTTKRFVYSIHLARYNGPDALVERIRTGNFISKHSVLDDMRRLDADPDILATSIHMSLKDPVSTMRITMPVRSTSCSHYQCFDGAMFLQLQEQAPQWQCPICNKRITFEQLCIDKYFAEILEQTSASVDKVDVEPNGEWKAIKDEDEPRTNGSARNRRASYDDDFDDEVIELSEEPDLPANGTVFRPHLMKSTSSAANRSHVFSTPPLSSRETSVTQATSSAPRPSSKRPASAVIDLTLSDEDEDEQPVRPAKRTTLYSGQSNTPLATRPSPFHAHASSSNANPAYGSLSLKHNNSVPSLSSSVARFGVPSPLGQHSHHHPPPPPPLPPLQSHSPSQHQHMSSRSPTGYSTEFSRRPAQASSSSPLANPLRRGSTVTLPSMSSLIPPASKNNAGWPNSPQPYSPNSTSHNR